MNTTADPHLPVPSLSTLLWRGFRQTCPRCGGSKLFGKYLKTTDHCSTCSQELGHIRADDFPPYLTMVVVGHIVVPLILLTEREFQPSISVHLMVWLPMTLLLTFWFLPRLKGMIIGLMLHLGLRGDESQ
jgi:uncharacterized protein (DUF983 family)